MGDRYQRQTISGDVSPGVTSVGAVAPIASTGGATPDISLLDVDPSPAGSYSYASITVDAKGRVIAAASGATIVPTFSVVALSAAGNASVNQVVLCDTSGGGFTVTLPTAVGVSGKTITVKKVSSDGSALTVDTTGGQTIDGQAQQVWTTQYTSMMVVSDGANWHII